LLEAPLAKGPRVARIAQMLVPLEEAMGGKIELDHSGRFYLRTRSTGRFEVHLVAEGLRKIATLARLIATGALLDTGYLFWDEPEANLNPRIVKEAARIILEVARGGIQVFVATHSLFLLRELQILQQSQYASVKTRCFGCHRLSDGSVDVTQGATMDDIGSIAALDEELSQSDRYLDLLSPVEQS
jgi:wobble nucleotide-excising tRNase